MSQTRQLAAIMFADIKGFTALMEQNEARAEILRQKLITSLQQHLDRHGGRMVKQMGDGALCMFRSSAEAVEAALDIQHDMQREPVVPLRIGIHSGDVLQDAVDIYGDSVNVASRVESFAVPGGIFLSGRVYEEIRGQAHIQTSYLGQFQFANTSQPTALYCVTNEGIAVPDKKQLAGKGYDVGKQRRERNQRVSLVTVAALALGALLLWWLIPRNESGGAVKQSSIAVLPFANLSGDSEAEYFSDGFTEDILTQISKIGLFDVISPATMRTYKNTQLSLSEIGQELNAQYVLSGSVRRQNDAVRISAQLSDAASNKSLWAETYDRKFSDVFSIQSDIAVQIAQSLNTRISEREKAQLAKIPTSDFDAYEWYLKGKSLYYYYQKDSNELAIRNFKNALATDRNYTLAWAGLADAYSQKAARFGFEKYWLDSARQAAQYAIRLDSTSSEAYKSLGTVLNYLHDYPQSLAAFQKAVAINPNNSEAAGNLGTTLFQQGYIEPSIRWQKKSAALNPKRFVPFYIAGWAYRLMGNYGEAEQWLRKSIELQPYKDAYRELGYTYLMSGQRDKVPTLINDMLARDSSAGNREIAGLLYFMLGDREKALRHMQLAMDANPKLLEDTDSKLPPSYAQLQYENGQRIEGELLMTRLQEAYQAEATADTDDDDPFLYLAALAAMQGQTEEALTRLKQANEKNWMDYRFAEISPWFQRIRNEAGFKSLMTDIRRQAAAGGRPISSSGI